MSFPSPLPTPRAGGLKATFRQAKAPAPIVGDVRTFIVRLLQDASGSGRAGAAGPRLRGVVDEVATGMRTTFRDDQELVKALMTAVSSGPPGPSPGAGDREAREPSSDKPDSIFGEK